VLVIGMLASKDCVSFLRNFTGLARAVIAVPVPHQERSLNPHTLAEVARSVGIPAQSEDDVTLALAAIRRMQLEPAPRILVTGSLHLAGDVLKENGTPP
jgi:dihydrofolate synthase/folylpolyglutamate synthase